MILFISLLFSCSNDKDENPTPIPRSLTITGITITDFPGTNDGSNWDLFDGPDIYLVLLNPAGTVLYTSGYIEDADPNNSYFFSPNVTIDPVERITFRLYDMDDFGADQYMGGQSAVLYDSDRPDIDLWDFTGDDIDATIKVRQNF